MWKDVAQCWPFRYSQVVRVLLLNVKLFGGLLSYVVERTRVDERIHIHDIYDIYPRPPVAGKARLWFILE